MTNAEGVLARSATMTTDFQREKILSDEIDSLLRIRKCCCCFSVYTEKLNNILYEYNETMLKMIYFYKSLLKSDNTIFIKRVQAKHMLVYLEEKLLKMREKISE